MLQETWPDDISNVSNKTTKKYIGKWSFCVMLVPLCLSKAPTSIQVNRISGMGWKELEWQGTKSSRSVILIDHSLLSLARNAKNVEKFNK